MQSATRTHLDFGGLSAGDNPSSVRSAADISGGPRSLQGAGLGQGMPGDNDMDFMSPAGEIMRVREVSFSNTGWL